MYERFTDLARRVMQLANQEAERLRHEYIGTEHILLGLISEASGVAANVLRNLGVEPTKVRAALEQLLVSGSKQPTPGELPTTPRAKLVIEHAIMEARELRHNYVGTEHLLLGLLRVREGLAARVLKDVGLEADEVREEVLLLLGAGPQATAEPTAAAHPPAHGHALENRRGRHRREAAMDVPAACPRCGASRVVHILWNRAHLTGSEQTEIDSGHAILGGRSETDAPSWACLSCSPGWMEVHGLAWQDYQWQLAKEEAVASEEWETAARLRDAQRALRLRLAALLQEPLGP